MIRPPPRSTLPAPPLPSTPLFRAVRDVGTRPPSPHSTHETLAAADWQPIYVPLPRRLSSRLELPLQPTMTSPERDEMLRRARHFHRQHSVHPALDGDRKSTRLNSSH